MPLSLDQISQFDNTGMFPHDDDVNDFTGILNNYGMRKFKFTIVPRSFKRYVSGPQVGQNEKLPNNTLRTTETFTLKLKQERESYERDGEYAELVENENFATFNYPGM